MHKSVYLKKYIPRLKEALCALNLDSIIISQSSLTEEVLKDLKTSFKFEIYVEITGFEGQGLLDKFPDAKSKTYEDIPTAKDWYVGVCPTHEGVRHEIKSRISKAIQLDVNGIWLQFMHYPTKWDDVDPVIMDSCYCDRCIEKFQKYVGDTFEYSGSEELYLLIDGSYYQEWLDFKAKNITSMFEYAKNAINESGKTIKLGYFTPPWDESEYRAGLQRILAQERSLLTPLVDVTSPMLFHKSVGEDVSWIKNKVDYFWNLAADFMPIIQSENIDTNDFRLALEYATTSPSVGVCVNDFDVLIEHTDSENSFVNNEKFKILKQFYEK